MERRREARSGPLKSHSKHFEFVIKPRRSRRKVLVRGDFIWLFTQSSSKIPFHWVDLDLLIKLRHHAHTINTKLRCVF